MHHLPAIKMHILKLICFVVFALQSAHAEVTPVGRVSPAAIGWGNLVVPGLGATLRDEPLTGLGEAGLEVGSFFGGTLLGHESRFKIDGSVDIPDGGSVGRAMGGRILQQFGLKYHFYNTFYHYQQAAIEQEDSPREKSNPQPIYRGTWKDVLLAPFQWDNIKTPWTWPIVVAVSTYLIYDYSQTKIMRRHSGLTTMDQASYGLSQVGAVPVGSSFGEDPLFRGFIQREIYGSTGSLVTAILTQTLLFSMLHEDHVTSFAVGSYFGIEVNQLRGDLGPSMAAHFWINMVIGVLDYCALQRSAGKNAPLNPPVVAQFTIPIF